MQRLKLQCIQYVENLIGIIVDRFRRNQFVISTHNEGYQLSKNWQDAFNIALEFLYQILFEYLRSKNNQH